MAAIAAGVLVGCIIYYTSRLAPRVARRVAAQTHGGRAASAAAMRQRHQGHAWTAQQQQQQQVMPYHAYEYGFRRHMDAEEARLLLGLPPVVSSAGLRARVRDDVRVVKARHRALVKELHSDANGSAYIASKLNEARDWAAERLYTQLVTSTSDDDSDGNTYTALASALTLRCALHVGRTRDTSSSSSSLLRVVLADAEGRVVYACNNADDTHASATTTAVQQQLRSAACADVCEVALCVSAAAALQCALQSHYVHCAKACGVPVRYNTAIHMHNDNKMHNNHDDSRASTIVLTSQLLQCRDDNDNDGHMWRVQTLTLLLLPAHGGLWQARRRRLCRLLSAAQQQQQETRCHTTDDVATQASSTTTTLLHACLYELLLCDVLLSAYAKLQDVWVQRDWLLHTMLQHGLVVHAPAGRTHNSSSSTCGVSLAALCAHERRVVARAADAHVTNYHAWQYARRLLQRRLRACTAARDDSGSDTHDTVAARVLWRECAWACDFWQTHNGDSSVTAYLLHLLQQQQQQQQQQQLHAATHDDAARMWRALLCLTQQELRRHADKGHEAAWQLRYGLVYWALQQQQQQLQEQEQQHATNDDKRCGAERRACATRTPSPRSAWRVCDELAWLRVYVDGYIDGFDDGSDSSKHGDEAASRRVCVLAPVASRVREAAVECGGGSVAWGSYMACRYGQQLLALLRTPSSSSRPTN